jgi:hypothetical protein
MSSIPLTPSAPELTPGQRSVLATLVEFPETTVKALAAAAGVGNSTAALALKLLETRELVVRTISPLADTKRRPADIWSAAPNATAALMTPIEADSAEDPPSGPVAAEPESDGERPAPDNAATDNPPTLRDDAAGAETLSLSEADADSAATVATPDAVSHPAAPTGVDVIDSIAERSVSAEPQARLGKGVLREAVLEHLRTHPELTFTPTALSKALTKSSGAISNSLDALVASGNAVLVREKPRTFQVTQAAL